MRAEYGPTGAPVSVTAVDRKEAEALGPWARVVHAHLAKLVDIIPIDETSSWVVVESPAGELLSKRLRSIGKKHPVDAVRTALRVADALAALHEAGGAHGRLNPENVLLSPEQGLEPRLLFGPAGSREYWPPDVSVTEPPSPLTDTWATGALLFHMLTGATPPSVGVGAADDLIALGIDNALLRNAVAHVLNRDKSARATTLQPLRRELARWFVEHVGDEPGPHSVSSHKPPPLPPSLRPGGVLASGAMNRARQSLGPGSGTSLKRYLVLAPIAVVLGLGTAYTIAALRKPKRVVVERVLPTAPANSASVGPGAIDLAEVPVNGNEAKAGSDSAATCIAGFLPENSLAKKANLTTFCPAADLRQAMKTLRAAFAVTPGGNVVTPKGWSDLGWFELAALATLRVGCCPNPPKFVWPGNSPDCTPLGDSLDALGKAVSSAQDVDAAISRFKEAAHCEVTKGKPDLSRPTTDPSADAERIFRDIFRIGLP